MDSGRHRRRVVYRPAHLAILAEGQSLPRQDRTGVQVDLKQVADSEASSPSLDFGDQQACGNRVEAHHRWSGDVRYIAVGQGARGDLTPGVCASLD